MEDFWCHAMCLKQKIDAEDIGGGLRSMYFKPISKTIPLHVIAGCDTNEELPNELPLESLAWSSAETTKRITRFFETRFDLRREQIIIRKVSPHSSSVVVRGFESYQQAHTYIGRYSCCGDPSIACPMRFHDSDATALQFRARLSRKDLGSPFQEDHTAGQQPWTL